MIYSEISGLTAKQILAKKKELQAAMFDARMKNSLGQLPNQMVIRAARKDIARLNTAMTLLAKKSVSQTAVKKSSASVSQKPAASAGKKVAIKKTATRGKKG